MTDSYVFVEILDENGALYLVCNQKYLKIG